MEDQPVQSIKLIGYMVDGISRYPMKVAPIFLVQGRQMMVGHVGRGKRVLVTVPEGSKINEISAARAKKIGNIDYTTQGLFAWSEKKFELYPVRGRPNLRFLERVLDDPRSKGMFPGDEYSLVLTVAELKRKYGRKPKPPLVDPAF